MMDLNGCSVLITGGTGSFGKKFIKLLLEKYSGIKQLAILSRDEFKQYELAQALQASELPSLKFYLGDIRDKDRLLEVTDGVDIIIHAAALKQVPASEVNPFEFIKTNINGTQNVIDAAIQNKVQKVIALSTDKAVAPVSLYGASKLCSDKLITSVNTLRPNVGTVFSVVRYGNVMGSRGSVIPRFLEEREGLILSVTNTAMTRFNATMNDEFNVVLHAMEHSLGGETFVPKLPSYNILDLAKAISPSSQIKISGIRPGEKMHEEMISQNEARNTIEFDKYYITLPANGVTWDKSLILKKFFGRYVEDDFEYNSLTNPNRLSIEELRHLISIEVDISFKPV